MRPIFPVSSPILLPLAPTIARTIANYLELMTQEFFGHLSHNCDNVVPKLPPDLCGHWQFEQSLKLVTSSPYQYVSTIAHRLAAKLPFTPMEICHHLQPPIGVAIDPRSCLELGCWFNDAGYIYFELTPISIALWLNYIHDLPLTIDRATARLSAPTIAIYAHARCCSVLQLAQSEKLVAITADWQISTDLSYLEKTSTAELRSILNYSAQQRLIHALMAVLDGIYSDNLRVVSSQLPSGIVGVASPFLRNAMRTENRPDPLSQIRSPNWTKLTLDLAQSWLEFYRDCRIFGDVQRQNPQLAIARCGLTAISRRYLQVLLENYLGISALSQL